jgi:hypothetical protein
MKKTIAAVMGVGALLVGAQGCVLQSAADKFREPIPAASDAQLALPGSAVNGSSTQSAHVRIQGGGGGGGGASNAWLYTFTRDISDGVDFGTVAILGTIVAITDNPPTTIDATHATWGPGSGSALDPITWKLVVTEVADKEYDYEIDGRPHLSTSDADWQKILTGHGFGKASPNYRSGWFQIDNDVYNTLDPSRATSTGSVKVTFDARTLPATIDAHLTTNDGTGQWYEIDVTHLQGGAGTVDLTALADISTPKDGSNENVSMYSRWDTTGAGRADLQFSGGDLKAQTAQASECWSDTYQETYYTDDVNYRPTSGSAAACAFPTAQYTPPQPM